jgi:peroxin-3
LRVKRGEQSQFNFFIFRLVADTKLCSFLSTLLPPTAETLHYVLTKAGLRVAPPSHLNLPTRDFSTPSSTALLSSSPSLTEFEDPALTRLLDETRSRLLSADFSCVLGAALDAAGDVLVLGLARSVFPHPRNAEAEAPPDEALVVPTHDDQEVKVRLAGMLPSLARWSRIALTGLPNELVDVSGLVILTTNLC